MRHIALTVSYDGTRYAGFQIQKNGLTVQGVLEKTLRRILKHKVRLLSSGRTDAGVHAFRHVVSFKTPSGIPLAALKRALNGLLPKDIIVRKTESVPLPFHPRFDAVLKHYRYTIRNHPSRSPFDRHYTAFYPYPLDIPAMRKASRHLVGKHDFKSFGASGRKVRHSVRHVHRLAIRKRSPYLVIDIVGNGFLYRMVRNIVGTLLEVGRGRRAPSEVKAVLSGKNRAAAGPTAPPQGLCLFSVRYRR